MCAIDISRMEKDEDTMKTKEKRMRVWVDIGRHGGVYCFDMGPVSKKYPSLLHVFYKKVSPDLKQATLIYKI